MAEAERAVSAARHVIVDMADFPAADQSAAQVCVERVRGCDVYVGVLGIRYGSPVPDKPEASYTELEFETATAAGLPRLMFLLDTTVADVGIPLDQLIDHAFGARQEAFRRRVQASGLVTQSFASPDQLGRLVERSLRELTEARQSSGPLPPGSVLRVWNVPARNPGFTGREPLLAAVRDRLVAGDRAVVQAFQGMGGVGKTQLAIEYAHRFADSYDVAWWVDADQAGLIEDQFAALGAALGCIPPGAGAGAVWAAVLAELHHRGRWLLVFDNAERTADVRPWLPSGAGHVLITSRERAWAEVAVPVEVDVLARAESAAILQGRVSWLGASDADRLAAELDGGPAGTADPAAHRPGRDIQVQGDTAVPGHSDGGDQSLPDQPGRVGAAQQQRGVEDDVRHLAGGAQCPVRARRHRGAMQVADGALAGVPPRAQRLAAVRAAQLAAGQRDAGRRGVEDLDHRPSRQDQPGRLICRRGGWCCSLAPHGLPRNSGALAARYRHRADAHVRSRPAGPQVTVSEGDSSARCRRRPDRPDRASHRHAQRRRRAKPWESLAPLNRWPAGRPRLPDCRGRRGRRHARPAR